MSGEPEIPLPSIPPARSPSPSAVVPKSPKPSSLTAALSAAPTSIDRFLVRLNKVLSTPSGTDAVLLLLCYSAKLSSSLLSSAASATLHARALALVNLALRKPSADAAAASLMAAKPSALAGVLLGLSKRLAATSSMLSDVRAFSRLWGLLGMYFWAKRLLSTPPPGSASELESAKISRLDKTVQVAQLATCIAFQSLENVAYLAQKSVIALPPKKIHTLYMWSSRFWAAYVGLSLGAALRALIDRRNTRQARRVAREKAAMQNMDPAAAAEASNSLEEEEREWLVNWRRGFFKQCAWAPITLHYSMEKGMLSDGMVGLFGSVPGLIGITQIWGQ